ncbi:MAG: Anthranilate synthase component and chorismate binding protein [Nocardioidaceae bacterium]|nr:Anthranilate synthase component and chorismate binding protein [Nocardioidaceae bacterium]
MPSDLAPEPTGERTRAALARVQGQEAWAVLRFRETPTVTFVGGPRSVVERLRDVPLTEGVPTGAAPGAPVLDRLLAIPFRQVAERGFAAHDDGTPLVVVDLAERIDLPLDEVLAGLPDVPVEFDDPGGFETSDEAYAETVAAIIRDEIGNGAGANLVIGRHYRAKVRDFGADQALTVLRRLLANERGAYWTFVVFTGDRYLVGASPERHVSVVGAEGDEVGDLSDVRMNPISGTFRLPRDAAGQDPVERRRRLLEFLADEKEIYELFMVVDEELKMMCDICHEGGTVLGPFLKPMTHLVHTEYLLAGRTRSDVRDVLRDTMYAATVTGSPVENACRLIHKYESGGRGYYGAALAVLGRDEQGRQVTDSPILIRTADVRVDGSLTVTAGATLVRDSDPMSEVAETHAKAGGILTAFGLVPGSASAADGVVELTRDDDVLLALAARNRRLSTFWLTDQSGAAPADELKGKSVVVLDGEDDFVNMLRHVFSVLGMTSTVVRHDAWAPGALDGHDLVVLGPGPGDPRDGDDPKIQVFRQAADALLASGQPFLAVCLGHQVLSERLGLTLGYKDIVFQGTQSEVNLFGREERVGFYNTFVARAPDKLPPGVEVATDPATGDVHQLVGPHYRGIQFHAESILTQHGFALLRDLLLDLLA